MTAAPPPPHTPRAAAALAAAVTEAVALGSECVGTEHLLLGLLRDPHSPAGHVLAAAGLTRDGVALALGLAPAAGSLGRWHSPPTPPSSKPSPPG